LKAGGFKKIIQSLNFFAIESGGEIRKSKALILIWLSDRMHLRIYGRTITGDKYYANLNGSIPHKARIILVSRCGNDIEIEYRDNYIRLLTEYTYISIKEVERRVFSNSDFKVMNIIYNEYGNFEESELIHLAKGFPEWKKFEEKLSKKIASEYIIEMIDFFENPNIKSDLIFNQSKELLELSKEDFQKSNSLRNT